MQIKRELRVVTLSNLVELLADEQGGFYYGISVAKGRWKT